MYKTLSLFIKVASVCRKMCDHQTELYIQIALKDEEFEEYKIENQGQPKKGENYLGKLTFASVTGKNKKGVEKKIDLVIKTVKDSKAFQNVVAIQDLSKREISIYEKVQNVFKNYQYEKRVERIVDILPHCYLADETADILILENLRSNKGYSLWNRKVPMTFDHIRLVLKAYGKWHALSLALKKDQPDIFKNLISKNNTYTAVMSQDVIVDSIWKKFKEVRQLLINDNKIEALLKLQFNRDDVKYIINNLYLEDPQNQVILHGDGWTNNFLFKYEENSIKPSEVKIIDWQFSNSGSPVIDISTFIYNCCSRENYEDLDTLLRIYHNSLSTKLKELGCEPKELFSFSTLKNHWRKFSKFGLIESTYVMSFSLCEEDEVPDFAEAAENGVFLKSCDFTLKNEDTYNERVKNNFLHYAQHVNLI